MTAKLRAFLRDFWTLAAPYWSSEERWAARGLLLVVVGLSLGQVYLLVQLNTWNRDFFDALQQFDQDALRRAAAALRRCSRRSSSRPPSTARTCSRCCRSAGAAG